LTLHTRCSGHNKANVVTPNMNTLIQNEAIELNRHYVFFYCSPTRSSLMTGRYPMHVTEDNNLACTVVGAVPVEMTMIPAKLKSKGYTSHHIGKWHLGQTKTTSLPINRGFDTDFSYLGGAEDHYTNENGGCGKCGKHVDLWRDHAPARGENGTGYTAFAWNNEAVKIIRGHEGDSNPWFMYLALQCAHAPNEPDVFAGLYSSDQHSEDYIDYNGMISAVDSTVGNVTSALKATNQWKNTLLVFTSDNGGPSGGSVSGASANNWPLRGGKHTAWEGGHRVLAFVTGGLVPAAMRGKKLEGYVHAADWCKQAPSNPPCAPACQANEPENRAMQM
jgi:arylsulfatase B